ncbi:MAG: hypothetical protein ACLQVG_16010 [Terriglobia bacterium]
MRRSAAGNRTPTVGTVFPRLAPFSHGWRHFPTAGAMGYYRAPLRGWQSHTGGWRRFPTAGAVGYYRAPLRG